jgi:hypothetical protein
MAVMVPAPPKGTRKPSSFPISHFPFPLSEADLSRLWQDQSFPPEALTTTCGERLRVVYRGRRTGGPGPDFRDALIAFPGGLVHGDVELHVRSSDFGRHGHYLDAAYANVVLHLVFTDDERCDATPLPAGGRAQVVALERWLKSRAHEIERGLSTAGIGWREPCFSAVAHRGAGEVAATLDRLGDMRFRARAAIFARRLAETDADQTLWEALLEALGYGSNHEAYRELASRVRWEPLCVVLREMPVALRAAEAYRLLVGRGEELLSDHARALRPANRPERRLRGAAVLAARSAAKGPWDYFAGILDRPEAGEPENGKRKTENGADDLRFSKSDLRRAARPFEDKRATSGLISALTVPGLIGRSRAIELLANAVLPLLAAAGPEDRVRRAEAAFRRLPLPVRYGSVRHLHEAVGGDEKRKTKNENRDPAEPPSVIRLPVSEVRAPGAAADGPGVRVDFRRQQGMLYLLKQYCTRGGCGRCPLS